MVSVSFLYIFYAVTNNNGMTQALVWLAAVGFALSVFPLHIYNYIYINSAEKYAGLNVGLYGKLNLLNMNSIKNDPMHMQINGKNKKVEAGKIKWSVYKIFNSLCIFKIVQLSDFGIKKDSGAYSALAQSMLTTTLYKFIQCNGHYAKLRNYAILNAEHGHVIYYAKAVTVINLFVIGKIIWILIMEKMNENKN